MRKPMQYAVVYKLSSGPVREWFKSVAAALEWGQVVAQYEGCKVYIQHGLRGPVTRVVV